MSTTLVVTIPPNDRSHPPGKLADVELHLTGGDLDGLRLIESASGSTAAAPAATSPSPRASTR